MIPTDFAAALRAAPDALHRFECLPDLQQLSYVLGIEEADSRATRRRRIEAAVTRLRARPRA
jgi:uncharacterized protein YdeI (YjbR/CyaY-like superfamily)